MPLPPVIEIEPLTRPVRAEIAVPGSKSITNRALVLAALGLGETELRGALWSEDTQVMVECLQELGFMVNVAPDPAEPGNRTLTVYGQGGRLRRGGTMDQPLELFVGNAGTAARFLAALVSLGQGTYRLHGVARMRERPQAALFAALRQLGYRIESPNDRLPAVIHGGGARPGRCRVSIEESSQFASALLLSGGAGGWEIEVTGENAEESPYVALTSKLIAAFPAHGGRFAIEPDCSSGSYFWAAGDQTPPSRGTEPCGSGGQAAAAPTTGASVSVAGWPRTGWQMDEAFANCWALLRAGVTAPELNASGDPPARARHPSVGPRREAGVLTISRRDHLGDSIMTAITLAPLLEEPVRFTELGRLRVQECERVVALRTELERCGARVEEAGDVLTVWPSKLHGAQIETYHDHRMALCFAILGLKVAGIRIQNPACVRKTFPNFYQKLATAPPAGLGAVIRDVETRQRLQPDALCAD